MVWNKTELENTTHPKCLGVTLDRSLSYKQHIRNTKMKVATRTNLLMKLATSKWGANPSTIRTTALALSYSTVEYAALVWARSSHAKNLDPELNQACRSVTGYLKPTNVEDLYLLSGIAPPAIRRDVCARVERETINQIPAARRLKSRHCFLSSVQPANFPAKVIRWSERQNRHSRRVGKSLLQSMDHVDMPQPSAHRVYLQQITKSNELVSLYTLDIGL